MPQIILKKSDNILQIIKEVGDAEKKLKELKSFIDSKRELIKSIGLKTGKYGDYKVSFVEKEIYRLKPDAPDIILKSRILRRHKNTLLREQLIVDEEELKLLAEEEDYAEEILTLYEKTEQTALSIR